MEMADAIVVNKADGDNVDKAEYTKVQLANALRLFPATAAHWHPPVITTSALNNKNIEKVWQLITDYITHTKNNGFFFNNRLDQSKKRFYHFLEEELFDLFYSDKNVKNHLPVIEKQLSEQKISAYAAGTKLIELYLENACLNKQKPPKE